MSAKPRHLMPGLAAVGGAEHGCVLDACVHGVGIRERWLEVPDALELPRMGRAVVPLMCPRHSVVDELVVHRVPRLAAIVRPLDELPEPAAALRDIDPVRISRRTLDVVDLPARKERTANVPLLPFAIRRQDKRAFPRAHKNSYAA